MERDVSATAIYEELCILDAERVAPRRKDDPDAAHREVIGLIADSDGGGAAHERFSPKGACGGIRHTN